MKQVSSEELGTYEEPVSRPPRNQCGLNGSTFVTEEVRDGIKKLINGTKSTVNAIRPSDISEFLTFTMPD